MLGIMLDGVLVQDQPITEGRFDLRPHLQPFFVPGGEFALLVDRDPLKVEQTSAWVVKHLTIRPKVTVYADRVNLTLRDKVNFRVSSCRRLGITTLVDSDFECVLKVGKELPNITVIHLPSYLEETLLSLTKPAL